MTFRTLSAFLVLVFIALPHAARADAAAAPRLVVMLVVDQLRGDMLDRLEDRFGETGFRYLMDEGTWYRNANYRHAVTFTAVGHASLATGGNAPEHGMSANDWFDTARKEEVYCLEDASAHRIGEAPKAHRGTSPKNLLAPSWGDAVVRASDGARRVFSVAIKDRGAIATAGHDGKAFWYDSGSGHFVTSSYYYDAYPDWVSAWNAAEPAQAYRDAKWELMYPAESYHAREDDRPQEQDIGGLGRTFPHDLGQVPPAFISSGLRFTPFGTELTLDFARTLIQEEALGQGAETDVINVGISPSDYIGHTYGPESLEYEDNLLRIDVALSDFFAFLDTAVGLEHTLIALSADHGSYEVPMATRLQREHDGQAPPDNWSAAANDIIQAALSVEGAFVLHVAKPWFYLDEVALRAAGADPAEAAAAVAEGLGKIPGVECALTRADFTADRLPEGALGDALRRSYFAPRCGHVMIVEKEGWQLFYKLYDNAGEHGSPWTYDTHVPVILAGPGIPARRIDRAAAPEDLAPTLSVLLGAPVPAGAFGGPYPEILDPASPSAD